MMNNAAQQLWVEVADLENLWEGEMLSVDVEGEHILVAHLPGALFRAYQGVCPHMQTPLIDGELEEQRLTCSSHRWEFDIMTGAGINPEHCQLYRYETKLEGEKLYVSIPQDHQSHDNRCRAS
jgi:toluene monooxygenase system ferredoxin subunit